MLPDQRGLKSLLIDYSLYLVTNRGLALDRKTVNSSARADGVPVVSAIVTAACPRKAQQPSDNRFNQHGKRNKNYGTA